MRPPVVEQQLVDISLKGGVNESDRAETLDWTKYLTSANNVTFEDVGAVKKSQGLASIGSSNLFQRLIRTPDGFGATGFPDSSTKLGFYQFNETDGTFTFKHHISEFSVTSKQVAAIGTVGERSCVVGVGMTSKYEVVLVSYQPISAGYDTHVIYIIDAYSRNILKTISTDGRNIRMVIVDNRYLHLYGHINGGTYWFKQLDLNSPAGLSSQVQLNSGTALAAAAVPVDAVAGSGYSVVWQAGGQYQKFNTSGTSVTSGTIAGFTALTGAATDGTNFFIVGYNATPAYVHKKISSAFAVTSTALLNNTGRQLRVAVNPSTLASTVLVYNINATGSNKPVLDIYNVADAGTTFTSTSTHSMQGWGEASLPVFIGQRCFVALTKLSGSATGASAPVYSDTGTTVLVDLTELSGQTYAQVPTAYSYNTYKPAAVLGNYTSSVKNIAAVYAATDQAGNFETSVYIYPHRPHVGSSFILLGTASLVSSQSVSYELHRLDYLDGSQGLGTVDCLSGAVPWQTDGEIAHEIGWYDKPWISVADSGVGTALDAGVHTYVAAFEYKDCAGNSHFSQMSNPATISTAGNGVIVTYSLPGVTTRANGGARTTVNIYRTTAGGTELRLLAKKDVVYSLVTTAVAQHGGVNGDAVTDAALLLKAEAYRQPLLQNPALDRYAPLATKHSVRSKDRIFYANKSNIYYSSFDVDGEAPWFNPSFFIPLADGYGDIVGLATLDGSLVAFKSNAVFIIDGDGPPENGGTGAEFSPPRRLQCEFGCIDPSSIVIVPDGIMYRSERGIELLLRNGSVKFIGQMVHNTVSGLPYTASATFDRENSRVYFLLGTGKTSGVVTGTTIVVFDLGSGVWCTRSASLTTSAAATINSIVYAEFRVSGAQVSSVVCSAALSGAIGGSTVLYETESVKTDNGNFSSMSLETGWIRTDSMQDDMRVSDFLVLCKNVSDHNLKISVAYNYSTTYSYSKTFAASLHSGAELKQVELQVPRQSVQAVRFKVEDLTPTGGPSVGTGKGPEILALTVKLGKKGGGAKLASANKG